MEKFLILQYDNRILNDYENKLCNINQKYCKLYNYDYIFEYKHYNLPPYWIKVYLTHKYMKTGKYKGILWLDTDACIYNFHINLELLLIDNKSFYLAPDNIKGFPLRFLPNKITNYSLFNAGVYFVLCNDMGRKIVNSWMNLYNYKDWNFINNKWSTHGRWAGLMYEQGSFHIHILPKYHNHIHSFKWNFLQSNYSNIKDNKNEPVFILHFASEKSGIKKYVDILEYNVDHQNTNNFIKPLIIFLIILVLFFIIILIKYRQNTYSRFLKY